MYRFYAYIPREDGSEPMGTANRILFQLKTIKGGIKRAKDTLGQILRVYTYTDFYDNKTHKLVYEGKYEFKAEQVGKIPPKSN